MPKEINIKSADRPEEEFGKYSWIKPAAVMGVLGFSAYAIISVAPYLLEAIQELFMFLIFFGMLS